MVSLLHAMEWEEGTGARGEKLKYLRAWLYPNDPSLVDLSFHGPGLGERCEFQASFGSLD